MTYDAREKSTHGGKPYELYLFETETASWMLSSADREITHLGKTYEIAAITRTATAQGRELRSGSVKITIPKDHPLAAEFIRFIPSTPMSLVIYRGHQDEAELVVHFVGGIANGLFTPEEMCELTAVPEEEILKSKIPVSVYQFPCNHIVYDRGCQADRASKTTTATVTAVDAETVTAAEFATKPDGWFAAGYLQKGTERRMIVDHTGDTVTLLNAMAGLAVDDEIDAVAGCQRTYQDCDEKFGNLVHYLGFEFIPNRNPFQGGVS